MFYNIFPEGTYHEDEEKEDIQKDKQCNDTSQHSVSDGQTTAGSESTVFNKEDQEIKEISKEDKMKCILGEQLVIVKFIKFVHFKFHVNHLSFQCYLCSIEWYSQQLSAANTQLLNQVIFVLGVHLLRICVLINHEVIWILL